MPETETAVTTNECFCGDCGRCPDVDAICCECGCHIGCSGPMEYPDHDDSCPCQDGDMCHSDILLTSACLAGDHSDCPDSDANCCECSCHRGGYHA